MLCCVEGGSCLCVIFKASPWERFPPVYHDVIYSGIRLQADSTWESVSVWMFSLRPSGKPGERECWFVCFAWLMVIFWITNAGSFWMYCFKASCWSDFKTLYDFHSLPSCLAPSNASSSILPVGQDKIKWHPLQNIQQHNSPFLSTQS